MPGSGDRVCILLGLYNGGAALAEQLESFAAQDHPAWDLLASDDGSTDASRTTLEGFAARMRPRGNAVRVIPGPGRGFVANFLHLLAEAPESAGWIALSDQDDVWLPGRLSRGIAALSPLPRDVPALYCSRTWVADEQLATRRLSIHFPRPPSFRNALVQNIAPGNTILLNRAAADLARAEAPKAAAAAIPGLAAHDWWLYQLVTGAGGRVICDPEPTLLYRQHARNLIGANDGLRVRMGRLGLLLSGRFRRWNAAGLRALSASSERLTPENRALLAGFAQLRARGVVGRLLALWQLGLYRQTRVGQATLWIAAALNRL